MNYEDLKKEADLLKITPKDIEIKDLKYRTQVFEYENYLKEFKSDRDKYMKKKKSLTKKKISAMVMQLLTGVSSSAISGGLMSSIILSPLGATLLASGTGITGIVLLITNEIINRYHNRYDKLISFINKSIVDYEKILKRSLEDKFIDEREGKELKSLYNFYIDNKTLIKKTTQINHQQIFGEYLNKSNLLKPEHLEYIKNFLTTPK